MVSIRRLLLNFLLAITVALALASLASRADPAASAPKREAGGPRELRWNELVPKGWNPYEELRKMNPALLDDSVEGIAAFRSLWDRAPTVGHLDGTLVKLPGYVVPLESTADAVSEFLLVPYFGACIHSPPPPANQIVHVVPAKAAKGLRAMDVVWAHGVIRERRRADAVLGASGYRIEAASIEPYVPPKR
jgi:hypothetical protein